MDKQKEKTAMNFRRLKQLADSATIVGLVGAIAVILYAVSTSSGIGIFFDLPSFLIVIVGSCFIVLIKFNARQFFQAWSNAYHVFFIPQEDPQDIITTIIRLQQKARIHGLLSLEDEPIDHPFLKYGIKYIFANISPLIIKNTLNKEIYCTLERHQSGARVFRALANVGPAMGMIGTLIGLVQMLAALDNPSSIGPSMAIALLTTLYGALLANMIATPIADKLMLRSQEEYLLNMLIVDGLLGLLEGLHPYILEEMLLSYLPASQRIGGRWKARPTNGANLPPEETKVVQQILTTETRPKPQPLQDKSSS